MIRYHILNGDSLKDVFPKEIYGTCIVARECLVDGDVSGIQGGVDVWVVNVRILT